MANKTGKGGFKKGGVGNKKGRKPIYEDFNARAMFLLEKYTVGQIIDRVEAVSLPAADRNPAQKKHFRDARKMPGRDFSILISISSSFTLGGALPFAALLDRAYGKTTQVVKVDQTITHEDHRAEAKRKTDDMLMRLAKRREAAKSTVH